MPDNPHLFLPSLSEQEDVVEPDIGRWDSAEGNVFRDIYKGIEIPDEEKMQDINSIPDVWARPLTFQSILSTGGDHPLYERVFREWKGLMSLLALRDVQDYDVEVASVSLRDGPFSEALRDLAPLDVQLEENQSYDWTDILLIRYEGIPVGGFSPKTLVYTGTDYYKDLRELPLSLQQRDEDGSRTGLLGPPRFEEERRLVGKWVEFLRDELSLTTGDGALLEKLLDRWDQDLSTGNRQQETKAIRNARPASSPVGPAGDWIEEYTAYKAALRPVSFGDDTPPVRSDLLLDSTRALGDWDHALIASPETLTSGSKIWNVKYLDHLGTDPEEVLEKEFAEPEGTRIGGTDIGKTGTHWVRPRKYFLSDILLEAEEDTFFPDETRGEIDGPPDLKTRCALPFRETILNYFSPQDIRGRLDPEFESIEGGIKFSFSLPLRQGSEGGEGSSGSPDTRTVRIEKTYRRDSAPKEETGTVRSVEMPSLKLFPKRIEGWQRYYLFQGGADTIEANPVRPSLSEKERVQTRHLRDGRQRKGKTVVSYARVVETNGQSAYPEAVSLQLSESAADGNMVYCGLLLADEESGTEKSTISADEWRVGIDFGTSNTTIYRSNGEPEKWTLSFSNHFRTIAQGPSQETEEELLRRYFLPDQTIEVPTPTFLRTESGGLTASPENEEGDGRLLLDYFPYFSSEYSIPGRINTNIKWTESSDPIDRFAEGVFFLILLEAGRCGVETLRLGCSYPEAFSTDVKNKFKKSWRDALKALTGINPDGPDAGDVTPVFSAGSVGEETGRIKVKPFFPNTQSNRLVAFEKEGRAAGVFFGDNEMMGSPENSADRNGGTICLDVGGRTTDISVWHDEEIVFNTSVQLAGKEVTEYIEDNPRVRDLIFSEEGRKALNEATGEKNFAARLNSVLREEGNSTGVVGRIQKHGTDDAVKRLRRFLTYEFGALAYFSGAALAATDRMVFEKDSEETSPIEWLQEENRRLTLYWGGNGAKLLRWIGDGTSFRKDGRAAEMLSALTYKGLSKAGTEMDDIDFSRIGHIISPTPKGEAAGGMSQMQHPGDHDPDTDNNGTQGRRIDEDTLDNEDGTEEPLGSKVVCGESIQINANGEEREVGFADLVGNEELFEGRETRYKDTGLDALSHFVSEANRLGEPLDLISGDLQIPLTNDSRPIVGEELRSHLNDEARAGKTNRQLRSPFIVEVEAFLDLV